MAYKCFNLYLFLIIKRKCVNAYCVTAGGATIVKFVVQDVT